PTRAGCDQSQRHCLFGDVQGVIASRDLQRAPVPGPRIEVHAWLNTGGCVGRGFSAQHPRAGHLPRLMRDLLTHLGASERSLAMDVLAKPAEPTVVIGNLR